MKSTISTVFPQASTDERTPKFPALPQGFKLRRRGACVPAAILLMHELVEGRDYVIEGYVRFAKRVTSASWHAHTWMEIEGQIYDPTLIQFRCLKTYQSEMVYRKTFIRHGADEWRHNVAMADPAFWFARLRSFGGRISMADLTMAFVTRNDLAVLEKSHGD